jgi:plasmid stabilization system protein ParE
MWYEAQLEGLGMRFENAIRKKLQDISSHPLTYSKKKGAFRQATIRNFPFVIVYKIKEPKNTIHISAIFHTKRNPKNKYRNI